MANTVIQFKQSLINAAPISLNVGEPAYSYVSNTLFIGTPDNAGFVKIGGLSEVLRLDEVFIRANAGFIKTNAAFGHANSAFIHANAAYLSQNTSGQYANGAYAHANAAYANANAAYVKSNSAYIHANSAYIETNAAFHHANSGFIKTNTSFAHANAAYSNANGAFAAANAAYIQANSGFIQTNSAFDHANAAYISQNATGQYANAAFTKANGAFIHANSGFIQSNAAFQRANNSLSANVGGVVTGDVTITGNLAVIGNTTYVNTSQVLIADNIITLNAAINQASAPILNAGVEIDRGIDANVYLLWNETLDKWTVTNDGTNYYVIGSDAAESYANSAFIKANASFDHANASYISQNATGQYANSAFIEANSAFIHANAAYQSQNATGNYANSAFIEANSAFIHANAAYQSQNATGNVANSGFIKSNAAFGHANAAYISQNATGEYANAAFIRANNSLNANVGGQVTGDVTFVGNVTSNTLTISGSNGTISGANAIFANYVFASNGTVDLYIYSSNAYANANAGFAKANAAFIWANAAYNQANTNKSNLVNTGYTAQLYSNSTFVLPGNLLFGPSNGIISNPDVGVISIQANDESGNTGLYLADVGEAVLYGKTGVLIQTNVGSLPKDFFFGADGTLRFPDSTKQNTAFIGYGIDNVARSHSNSAYESQNSTGQYANAAFIKANSAFHHANSAYATANVKTETFIQTTAPASANVDDIWIDSLSGIQYVYVNSNSANQWVEFGPYGSPLNGTANVQFADQTIFTVKSGENLVLLSSGADIHLNASANVVTTNLVPSNPTISLGSADRPFKNVWVSNASIHLSNNGLRITSETNPENVVIESGGLIIRGGALRANSFLDVTHLYALNVESSLVISNATFSSQNALVKIVGSNSGYSLPPANPGYMLHITGKPNTASRIVNDSFGVDANTYPAFIGRAARGTVEAPTAVKAGDVISRFAGSAYNGTNFSPLGTGRIDIYASEDHTVSNTGTYIVMSTVANNTNIVSNIAMFDGNTSIIYGSLQVTNGHIHGIRRANVANSTAVTINYGTDSFVRATVNANMTVTHTGFVFGKVVELWVQNRSGVTRTITHGITANNTSTGSATSIIPASEIAVFRFMSWDGDLANTQVSITSG